MGMAKPLGTLFVSVPCFSLCFSFILLSANSSPTFVLREECGPSELLNLHTLFPGTWREKLSLSWCQFPKSSFRESDFLAQFYVYLRPINQGLGGGVIWYNMFGYTYEGNGEDNSQRKERGVIIHGLRGGSKVGSVRTGTPLWDNRKKLACPLTRHMAWGKSLNLTNISQGYWGIK